MARKKKIKWNKLNRKTHYWGSIICAIPVIIIIITGMLLMFKKQSDWIQPPSTRGISKTPSISFEHILVRLQQHNEININSWNDIKRLDIRPSKGIMKIQLKTNVEIQMDSQNGEILQIAFRRSDIIESIHDGSFFHDNIKYFLFFPAAIILLILWITGIYLFINIYIRKRKERERKHLYKNQRSK